MDGRDRVLQASTTVNPLLMAVIEMPQASVLLCRTQCRRICMRITTVSSRAVDTATAHVCVVSASVPLVPLRHAPALHFFFLPRGIPEDHYGC